MIVMLNNLIGWHYGNIMAHHHLFALPCLTLHTYPQDATMLQPVIGKYHSSMYVLILGCIHS